MSVNMLDGRWPPCLSVRLLPLLGNRTLLDRGNAAFLYCRGVRVLGTPPVVCSSKYATSSTFQVTAKMCHVAGALTARPG